jgi:microsomal dipeptidase-like Zn-dependent dipeptidase
VPAPIIDALQYCNWSQTIFRDLYSGGVAAVHATICYHENFRETVANIAAWNRRFDQFPGLIFQGFDGGDVRRAASEGRTAIFLGSQNPSCIEDDIGLVEILHRLGLRFMQLSYNNQSLLASGCYEREDTGLTRMGREVVREMNRVGLVIDMSHSGERSTLEAIAHSTRPIAITHANPRAWHDVVRNKSDEVLRALRDSGGMLGLSLYPHHLKRGPDCTLKEFCEMAARTAELVGIDHLGLGSDLCQDQPDWVVRWMRQGRWTKGEDDGGGFPPQPVWFRSNRDHRNIAQGLKTIGFADAEMAKIMGGNWLRFFEESFGARAS